MFLSRMQQVTRFRIEPASASAKGASRTIVVTGTSDAPARDSKQRGVIASEATRSRGRAKSLDYFRLRLRRTRRSKGASQ
jgi:hypothetical protein